jgi:hypothetical protein
MTAQSIEQAIAYRAEELAEADTRGARKAASRTGCKTRRVQNKHTEPSSGRLEKYTRRDSSPTGDSLGKTRQMSDLGHSENRAEGLLEGQSLAIDDPQTAEFCALWEAMNDTQRKTWLRLGRAVRSEF